MFLLINCVPIHAATVYVNSAAGGANDGSSWANAYTGLQAALTTANSGDEIWVAAGTYYPGAARSSYFQMKDSVGIYGGFAGTEAARGDRNPAANVTTLSGDIGTPGDSSDNCYHVFFHESITLTATAILDGFTITGGRADLMTGWEYLGGGMFNGSGCAPTVNSCIFTGNYAEFGGGGMCNYNSDASPTVSGCVFIGNQAQYGGGMYNYFYASPTVTNCTFSLNSAEDGGAMYLEDSFPTVANCILWGNSATMGEPEIYFFDSSFFFNFLETITYSDIEGSYAGGSNNINADPGFSADGYHLSPGSPCTNTGSNTAASGITVDIDGETRITDVTVDMGADEYVAVDTDGDGVIDSLDVCPGSDDTIDADGDGVPDGCDACPGSDDNIDVDNDNIPDGCDPLIDSDGDGVADASDVCPGSNDNVDTDGDGIADGCDACPGSDDASDADGDGVPDGCDVCPGSDDASDADGDGVPDGCDVCPGSNDASDADGDGVPDGCDVCPGSNDASDADSDGVPDGCDACPGSNDASDADGDGVPDGCDACPGSDDNIDLDNNGIPDGCDTHDSDNDGVVDADDVCNGHDDTVDTDGDGVPNGCDVCDNHDDNIDVDNDGTPDGCDPLIDSDGDGVADADDACNGHDDSIDVDNDGTPDGCDPLIDSDGDGVSDSDDACPGFNDYRDGDSDGIPDGCDPLMDSDGDGVSDADDICFRHDDNIDTDGDGVPDGCDICEGHDDSMDVDNDGTPDGCDPLVDSDNDGVADADDVCDGYDDTIDVDNDGTPDGCDPLIDSDGDGVANADDTCNGHDDTIDIDNDGIPDGCDSLVDSDGDGLSDSDEIDTYGTDPSNDDSDGDGYTDMIEIECGSDPNDADSVPSNIYVDADAAGANDGSSWTDAYNDLQDALSDARTSGNDIWVAAGTYYPGSGRYDSFEMINGVAIYGGFAGVETDRDDRNPAANVTILSGGNICKHVIDNQQLGATAVLDGFTVTAGSDGGMNNYYSSPTITNCTFSGNSATFGGGMDNSYSSPTITNCTFSGNTAENYGGGMYNDNSSPTITNCTFSYNYADKRGGGMFNVYSSSPTLTNCTFSGNSAGYYGGGMVNSSNSSPTLTNCTFSGNTAGSYGGGMSISSSSPTVTNCILWGNTAGSSGDEIDSLSADPIVTYSNIKGGHTGTGNIDADPMFAADGIHLTAGSPCIDAGDSTAASGISVDMDGEGRIIGSGVDMGADEYAASDTDGDGVIDGLDVCQGFNDVSDADGDGVPDGCDVCESHDDGIDIDNDGIPDGCDVCDGHDDTIDVDSDGTPDGCDPLVDSDSDGVADDNDICEGYNDTIDVDNDGTPDGCDSLIDSDDDGVADADDVCDGHDDSIDVDNDGTPDGCDPLIDSDGDGLSDEEENTLGTNPNNDDSDDDGLSDGDEVNTHHTDPLDDDSDDDGHTDKEEVDSGTNPNDADNNTPPEITAPDDVTVNATGLFTEVDLGVAVATDTEDGNLAVTVDSNGFFSPGSHTVTWSAVDSGGMETTAIQFVNVIPQVSLSKDQNTAEGAVVTFSMILNGPAVTYPIIVPFTVVGTADSSDHDLMDGSVRFEEGETSASVSLNIFDDGVAEGTESIVVAMGEPVNAVPGTRSTLTINIFEENIAPDVTLEAKQADGATRIVSQDGGLVTVEALVTDPNANDRHSYDWSATDNALVDSDNDEETFTFDPAALTPGFYSVSVEVSDGDKTAKDCLKLSIEEALPELSNEEDSDGDGVSDRDEGVGDDDDDGIPDYLDSANLPRNVLQEQPAVGTSHLMETEPGLVLTLGETALRATGASTEVTEDDIVNHGNEGQGAQQDEEQYEYNGGLFDFNVEELPEAGQSVSIVVAQFSPVPANAVYRKLMPTGWQDFVLDDNNSVASALGVEGFCPPPGDVAYTTGLTEGHWCVQLTIEDGGPNDADGEINQSIDDPGGVATIVADDAVDDEGEDDDGSSADSDTTSGSSSGGGCFISSMGTETTPPGVGCWFLLLLGAALLATRTPGMKQPRKN